MPGAVILPVLGKVKAQFLLDDTAAWWLASSHYLTVALFSPILGIAADRIGRMRVLVISLLLFALFGIAGTWATTFLPMLVSRMLLGAATGGIAAASLGILAEMYQQGEDRSHAIALASSAITLANIVYPLLAGLVGRFNWQWAFYLYGISIPIALLSVLKLSERGPNHKSTSLLASNQPLSTIIATPQVMPFFIGLTLTSATAYATITNLSLYLSREPIKIDSLMIAIVLVSQAIGSAVASAVGLKFLTRRFGTVLSIGIGFGLMAFSLATIPTLHQLAWLMPVVILFGVGIGIVMPSFYGALANLTPTNFQSTVLAVGTGVTFLGQFLSPALFSVVFNSETPTTTFYTGALIVLAMGLLLLLTSRKLIQAEVRSRQGNE